MAVFQTGGKNAGVKGNLFGEESYATFPKNGWTLCLDTVSKNTFPQNLMCFVPGSGMLHRRMAIVVLYIYMYTHT